MHDDYVPHCSYCKHFVFSLRLDLVIEWGYCSAHSDGADAGFQGEIAAIKQEVAAENYQPLLDRAGELGLFIPKITSCRDYEDIYPF